MSILSEILDNRWILRYIFKTIYFNFHYLPFKQAIRLPILLHKPHLISCKGRVKIDCDNVEFGMIRLGVFIASTYLDSGINFNNRGGDITFKGHCIIGNNSALVVGERGDLIFGEDFLATASVKIVSFKGITFGARTRLGWECIVMDTNFHPIYDMERGVYKRAYGKIVIGDYNWFATQSVVLHSVVTPERAIFGMRSVVMRGSKFESYALHGGSPLRVLARGVMRDYENDLESEYADYEG